MQVISSKMPDDSEVRSVIIISLTSKGKSGHRVFHKKQMARINEGTCWFSVLNLIVVSTSLKWRKRAFAVSHALLNAQFPNNNIQIRHLL